jgi:hypothetical protein
MLLVSFTPSSTLVIGEVANTWIGVYDSIKRTIEY